MPRYGTNYDGTKCIECRDKKALHKGRFCGAECRRKFNNRRATRGALLYDAMMVRVENPKAAEANALDGARVEALLLSWRDEDTKAGRTTTTDIPWEIRYKLPAAIR